MRARFFELTNQGLIVMAGDDDGRSLDILDANVSAARMLGLISREDVIGLSPEALVHGWLGPDARGSGAARGGADLPVAGLPVTEPGGGVG